MTQKRKTDAATSYTAASAELDEILQAIESGAADLDQLSLQVERAAVLLAQCRDQLAATESKVKVAVEKLSTAVGGTPPAAPPATDDDEQDQP